MSAAVMFARPSGIITLTTDFGRNDPYVGIVEGAVMRVSDKPRIVHLSHAVPPQDLATGAFMLWTAIGRFPAGTVNVGVVDPGVGSDRALLAVSAFEQYWLVPDNGIIGAVLADAETGWEARRLDLEHLRIRREAVTFDGRDVFAPVAAMLASGRYGFRALGPRVESIERGVAVFEGGERIVYVDHYGNLVTNVRRDRLDAVESVRCGNHVVRLARTYAEVAIDEPLAYIGSFGLLEIAVRDGDARRRLEVEVGAPIELLIP